MNELTNELTTAEVEAMGNLLRLKRALENADRLVKETAEDALSAEELRADVRFDYETAVSAWRGRTPPPPDRLPPLLPDPVVPGP